MPNLARFTLNSNYPIDTLVLYALGNAVVPYNYTINTTIPHSRGMIMPLVIFSWDGINWWDAYFTSEQNSSSYYAVNNGVVITQRLEGLVGRNIQYRVYGFPVDETDYPTNVSASSKFSLNSQVGYEFCIKKGTVDVPANTDYVVYDHNLGYYPNFLAWTIASNRITPMKATDASQDAYVTTSQFKVWSTTARTVHYRIYGSSING